MSKRDSEPVAWENVLSSAARLQAIVPGAVLVGGTASAIHARHRLSFDHDHVVTDLRERFDGVLTDLEGVAGWKTARVNRPVQILGSLDGIQTGVRQLIRSAPLETTEVAVGGSSVKVPTFAEILRIKGFLILARNATRDYVDFAALGTRLGSSGVAESLAKFDELYPQENGESALQQLCAQMGSPKPYDLNSVDLSRFKELDARWHTWDAVSDACGTIAVDVFREVARRTQDVGRKGG